MNAAIVLCGGLSRRLGRDKCQVPLGHQTLIGHVLSTVHKCVEIVHVVGRPTQRSDEVIPTEFRQQTSFVVDEAPDGGPLEGFRTGLSTLPDSATWVLLCGCDFPLLRPKFIEFLFRVVEGFDAAVPFVDDKLCPMPAVYHRRKSLDRLGETQAAGERSLWKLVQRLDARRLTRDELQQVDPGLNSLINVNDAPTLETAAMIWAQRNSV